MQDNISNFLHDSGTIDKKVVQDQIIPMNRNPTLIVNDVSNELYDFDSQRQHD